MAKKGAKLAVVPMRRLEEVRVHFTTTAKLKVYLERAVATGLYGKNASEAAERMVARGIEDMIAMGQLVEEDE